MRKRLGWVAVFIWMLLIFYLSHQPANLSNELSKGVTKVVSQQIEVVSSGVEYNFTDLNNMIRKHAHFLLYFVLGVLVVATLRKCRVTGVKGILLSVLICVLFAISDEWHQLFVDGRGGQISDVVIDSAGAIVGIVGYVGMGWLVRNVGVRSVET